MKTLKRIGLFLWLKLVEISIPLLLIILGLGIILGLLYLIIKYAPLLFVSLLVLANIYVIFCFGKDWIADNWKEVKRRIP